MNSKWLVNICLDHVTVIATVAASEHAVRQYDRCSMKAWECLLLNVYVMTFPNVTFLRTASEVKQQKENKHYFL